MRDDLKAVLRSLRSSKGFTIAARTMNASVEVMTDPSIPLNCPV